MTNREIQQIDVNTGAWSARRNGKLQAALEAQLERATARSLERAAGPRRIGTDIVEITRVERALARWGDHFTARAFTEAETSYCQSKHRPGTHFAGKLAAKEAVYKALAPDGAVPFSARTIEVLSGESGEPVVRLTGKLAKWVASGPNGPLTVVVSISHAGDYAIAVAVA